MASAMIVAIDVLGAVFFFMAMLWAYHNYAEEIAATEFWIVYAAAAYMGAMFMLLSAVEWMGIAVTVLDDVKPLFEIITITLLVMTSMLCTLSPIKRQVK